MHRVAPCQQDGLEMVPLGQVSSHCHSIDNQQLPVAQDTEAGDEPEEDKVSSLSQHSCWVLGDLEQCPGEEAGGTQTL